MIGGFPAARCSIRRVGIIRSTKATFRCGIECGMGIAVDQQRTFDSICGADNRKRRYAVTIRNVRNVVNMQCVQDHVFGAIQVQCIEVACLPVILERCAMRMSGESFAKNVLSPGLRYLCRGSRPQIRNARFCAEQDYQLQKSSESPLQPTSG